MKRSSSVDGKCRIPSPGTKEQSCLFVLKLEYVNVNLKSSVIRWWWDFKMEKQDKQELKKTAGETRASKYLSKCRTWFKSISFHSTVTWKWSEECWLQGLVFHWRNQLKSDSVECFSWLVFSLLFGALYSWLWTISSSKKRSTEESDFTQRLKDFVCRSDQANSPSQLSSSVAQSRVLECLENHVSFQTKSMTWACCCSAPALCLLEEFNSDRETALIKICGLQQLYRLLLLGSNLNIKLLRKLMPKSAD